MRRRGDLGLRHAGLGQPLGRQVDAAVGGVLDHVAGDVGELEGEAEVLGAAQGGEVVRLHAHHERHHHAHHARHVPAVVERVLDGLVAARRDVHGEAVEQLDGVAFGDVAGEGHALEGGEVGIVGGLAGQRAPGLRVEPVQPRLRRLRAGRGHAVAELLAVDHVVAVPAPGVEHLGVDAGLRRRTARRRRRSSSSPSGWSRGWTGRGRWRARRGGYGHAVAPRSASISPAVALAEPITPGTPAPGWVPAPTK